MLDFRRSFDAIDDDIDAIEDLIGNGFSPSSFSYDKLKKRVKCFKPPARPSSPPRRSASVGRGRATIFSLRHEEPGLGLRGRELRHW